MNDEQTPSSVPSGPARTSRRRWLVWLVLLVIAAAVVPAAWVYLGSPAFCNSCHEMKPVVAGWEDADHGTEEWASCLDCHADPGLWGEFVAHVGGALYVYKHFESPEATDLRAHVESEWCNECHADAWDDAIFAAEHPTEEAQCAVCHRATAHANENPVYPVSDEGEGGDS